MTTYNESLAFIANGEILHTPTLLEEIFKYPKVIAVDGGLNFCDQMHITPFAIIGDLDSSSPEFIKKYSHIPIYTYPKDKDESDLELALKKFATNETEKLSVFGALGKRADHSQYNLFLLKQYPQKLYFETAYESIFSLNEGVHQISTFPGQTISLLPLGNPCFEISTNGLKWELKNKTIKENSMSLSNISLKDRFTIEIKVGSLICYLQKGIP